MWGRDGGINKRDNIGVSSEQFFESPILNSPYAKPERHWQLGEGGQPTGVVEAGRRRSDLTTPIPKPRATRGKAVRSEQADFLQGERGQEYNPTETINGIRSAVESWRDLPESQWQVTATTARLMKPLAHASLSPTSARSSARSRRSRRSSG